MRNIFHIVISLFLWGLFGYYWYVVGKRQITAASIQAVGILALVTLLGLILTVWWIAHNKKLASRNRREKAPDTPPEVFKVDTLDRPLVSPGIDVLKQATTILISLNEDNHKVYSVGEEVGD